MRLTVCCQDGQGGQCQAVHQPAAGGASRGGRDPGHPGGRVTDVQGPGQDGQVSRGPQAAQGGAGRHGHQGELSLIIWWLCTGPGDYGAQEGPGQDSPGSPEDSITEAKSGQQEQQWRGEFPRPSHVSHWLMVFHIPWSVCVICSKFFLCHSNHVWTMPGTWRSLAPVYWVWVSSSSWKPSAHWFLAWLRLRSQPPVWALSAQG